jgi:hypothetical protein
MNPSSRLRLGWLLPTLLFLGTAGDLACRLVRPEAVAFRAWEAMTSRPSTTGPFRASARFETASAYGDLASAANLPALRHYHEERFTTDAHGFRNAPGILPPAILLVGDSFGAGCGVNDEETLSAVMQKELDRAVYNAAGFAPSLDELRSTIRRLGMTRGVVVYEHVERWGAPSPFKSTWRLWDKPAQRRIDAWVNFSPLQIWCQRAHRRLENGEILPNSAEHEIVRGTLPGGEVMLFLRLERELKRTLEDADRAAVRWRELSDELKKDGLDLIVVLAPNKSTIYAPLTREGGDMTSGRAFLGRIQERLRALGVPALDLSPELERAARAGIGEGRLLYRPDDTHWTPEGQRVAAIAIAGLIRSGR